MHIDTCTSSPDNLLTSIQSVIFNLFYFISVSGEVWPGYEHTTAQDREARNKEIVSVLQFNLNNPLVEAAHILFSDDSAVKVPLLN